MSALTQIPPLATADTLATANLRALFGPDAELAPTTTLELLAESDATHNALFGVVLIALFVGYIFHLVTYGSHIPHMAKILIGDNLGIRVADELSYLFIRAQRLAVVMGVVCWSLIAVKWLELSGLGANTTISSVWFVPIFAALAVGVIVLQRILTNFICGLTRRTEVAEGLNLLYNTTMAVAAIVATPLTLLFAANTAESSSWLGIATLVVAGVALLIYVVKSLIFFIEQKISILLWFLYLCTVILIPIGIVLMTVVGYGVA